MASRRNPIERRIGLIHDHWVEFAELPAARVLCFLAKPDEVRMVDAFVATESDERAGTLPDLFVELSSSFDVSFPYGYAACEEFVRIAAELHAGLEDPATAPWKPPEAARGEEDVALWVKTCESFCQHYALPGHLAVLLRPTAVSHPDTFQLWLQRWAMLAPENVRAILVDDGDHPVFEPLVKVEPERVIARRLDLDMAGARLELSQGAGGLDTPGGRFRHAFVKLSNALESGKLAEAQAFGKAALGIAQAQKWFALAVPVHFSLGAALAGEGKGTEASAEYLKAEIAAAEGEEVGDPVCTKLRAQARMARGGLLVALRQYQPAAELFTNTLPLATAAEDPRMVLDCYRLASFSYEQDGSTAPAWQAGLDGLRYAKTLDPETCKRSTLPYLGEGLMRMTRRSEYSGSGPVIEKEMVTLLGTTDWRPKVSAPPPGIAPTVPGGAP